MNLVAYCPACRKRVTVTPLISREALKSVVEADAPVRVMHSSEDSDHIWTLSAKEATTLAKRIEEGLG